VTADDIPGNPVTVTFDARSGPSGEIPSGSVVLDRDAFQHESVVTCLKVSGNRARVGGRIVTSTEPFLIGWTANWEVVDGGTGGTDAVTVGNVSTTGAPPSCNLTQPVSGAAFSPIVSGDLVVTDAHPARMVGKGAMNGIPGGTASYAYNVGCYAPGNTSAPFEARFGSQRFRLTGTVAVECSDDPTVSRPAGRFDTQVGTGSGTLTSGGPGTITWGFVDGGSGGANDSARIQIVNATGTIIFQGVAAPPGKFPGSTQATGYNTAQLLP
jgi:hypothetical protein